MEILRIPPYPVTTTWDVPEANAEYTIYLQDLVDHSSESVEVVSNSESKVEYIVTRQIAQLDRQFTFQITDSEGEIVVDSTLDILRPYVDYRTLGTTASEIQEYKVLELVARGIIDSIISEGFYNKKKVLQVTGYGADYFPLWDDTNKVLQVYENNVLSYDIAAPEEYEHAYTLTLDKTAIQRVEVDAYNRSEAKPLFLPISPGNLGFSGYIGVDFPHGYDYTFVLDIGYKSVPADIEEATKMLMEDIKCGKLDYYKRYVAAYNTEQFRIQFDKSIFNGTGNLLVDKILEKYEKSITRIGII